MSFETAYALNILVTIRLEGNSSQDRPNNGRRLFLPHVSMCLLENNHDITSPNVFSLSSLLGYIHIACSGAVKNITKRVALL